MLKRYKLVVRGGNGKVVQIHECYQDDVLRLVMTELEMGYTVTVTELKGT
jgi:hypothetical protein